MVWVRGPMEAKQKDGLLSPTSLDCLYTVSELPSFFIFRSLLSSGPSTWFLVQVPSASTLWLVVTAAVHGVPTSLSCSDEELSFPSLRSHCCRLCSLHSLAWPASCQLLSSESHCGTPQLSTASAAQLVASTSLPSWSHP